MSVSPEKYSYAKPVTVRDDLPDPDPLSKPIPYKFTPGERDELAIARIELEAHKRAVERHRDPEGLTVTSASWDDFLEARRAFGRHG